MLHDVGKSGVPASILNKPGKLSAREFEIMKEHTRLGAEMLTSLQGDLGIMAQNIAEFHHEWYDGSKSYWGKRARDLPAYVSIVSICDVFTALVAKRPYKEPWPPKDAIAYIQNKAGTQFCPELVRVFTRMIRNDSRVPAIFMAC
jgi:putative two-component system response regulator